MIKLLALIAILMPVVGSAELDPKHKSDYTRGHAAFLVELDALDKEISTLLAAAPNRAFMVFHPAWVHFADTYGLVQIPIENEGKEPGPSALTGLIEQTIAKAI